MLLWMPSIPNAIQDFEDQNHLVLCAMSEYLGKLPKNSPVIEVGSRNGDFAVALAKRFPDLFIQPTEGTGQTSQSLFNVLEERVRLETLPKGGPSATPRGPRSTLNASPRRSTLNKGDKGGNGMPTQSIRLLPPRPFDASQDSSFTTSVGRIVLGALVALNALQYVSRETVHNLLSGGKRALRRGCYLMFAGAFFEGSEVSSKSMLYHSALQQFEMTQVAKDKHHQQTWGLHDVNWIRQTGEHLGLEFVALKRVGLHDPDDCLLLVMRKPLHALSDGHNRRMLRILSRAVTNRNLPPAERNTTNH